ncbi:DUF742 domain-containing protein [Saccharopolyspora sp. TS4A08]|jgi:hypothetical protein|uniref:DUF742 domain-containing protein n=3 Tax=Saccharopolyspora TaxID=1835 RepID=A0A4R4VBP5_9PSEU|nr:MULTISPECIES: DUF742 domain-containing protein [Saccharopolyspora]MBQ0924635.1 DUF742 domain-containing protein [Saccharopolyspora endophytica]MDI2032824.1 DUF742 domain-containing protein [Saccharopolyspora sp. TS4A08]TDC99902.1 DUF742 domain-containing protein [Saccharopolyspora terrae]
MSEDGQLWLDEESGPLVRPYAMVHGRTRPARPELDVATQLLTSWSGADRSGISVEHEEILRLCVRPMSIAEVAAHLDTPIVVAKVLVSDLIDRGDLVTDKASRQAQRPNRQLLEAVLEGVRRL